MSSVSDSPHSRDFRTPASVSCGAAARDSQGASACGSLPRVTARTQWPTIAVLDDEDEAAATICECLALRHFKAIPFTDAADVVEAARLQRIDAFVLDWCLGLNNSGHLVEALRASPQTSNVPIFILTGTYSVNGRPTDASLTAAIKRHALHYRRKPLTCADLANDLLGAIAARQRN